LLRSAPNLFFLISANGPSLPVLPFQLVGGIQILNESEVARCKQPIIESRACLIKTDHLNGSDGGTDLKRRSSPEKGGIDQHTRKISVFRLR
jgi:hypothetical protein